MDIVKTKKSPTGYILVRTSDNRNSFKNKEGFKTISMPCDKNGNQPDLKEGTSPLDLLEFANSDLNEQGKDEYLYKEEAEKGHRKIKKKWEDPKWNILGF